MTGSSPVAPIKIMHEEYLVSPPLPKGRIAGSWGTHLITHYDPKTEWGITLCEEWSGLTEIIPKVQMTCDKCAAKAGTVRDRFTKD